MAKKNKYTIALEAARTQLQKAEAGLKNHQQKIIDLSQKIPKLRQTVSALEQMCGVSKPTQPGKPAPVPTTATPAENEDRIQVQTCPHGVILGESCRACEANANPRRPIAAVLRGDNPTVQKMLKDDDGWEGLTPATKARK